MAFEINDLKGILILVLFAIPTVASTNINCSGKAFHCVNSTHFLICVDLGGGVSTTIDDFVIPCPEKTVCNENNIFECDFPEDPTPPLQVIGVNKQSDTSEATPVTNSVTTPSQTSEIFSVIKENITATNLPIPEDVTPAVKLEIIQNIKNSAGGNSYNTTETSAPFRFIDSTNETVKDKLTSDSTVTISATDNNNKNLETIVETQKLEAGNASATDKSTPIDTVAPVIGLINLISTDPLSEDSTKPSSNVLTSLDSPYDIIATTTGPYITKEVTIHSENVKNVTDILNISTEIIFTERSITTDGVSTTPVVNTIIVKEINNKFENMNKSNSGNNTIAEQNNVCKSNNTNKLVPETTTEYLTPIKTINVSEPITVYLSPQITTDSNLVPLGLVDSISAEPKQSIPSTNDYIDTFYGNNATITTTDQVNTKLETKLSAKPVTAEVISTTPITNMIVQNVINNDSTTELNSTSDIKISETVPETKTNDYVPEPITVANLQTTTETFFPKPTEANIKMYITETIAKSEASILEEEIFNNDSYVERPITQPLEIIIATNSPTVVTDNLYQINGDFNQTLISTKNTSVDTMNTTEIINTVYNASGTDNVNKKGTEPILVLPSVKDPVIEITIAETSHNEFTAPAIEVSNESTAINVTSSVNETLIRNGMNDTLLDSRTHSMITTETPKVLFNIPNSGTEPATIEYTATEISTPETVQNESKIHAIDAKNRSPGTGPMSVHTTPEPHSVTSGLITNIVKDLPSHSEFDTNLHTGFTTEVIAHNMIPDGYNSVDQGTTQSTITDPGNKILESINQPDILKAKLLPEILNADQWTKTVPDVVSTLTNNLNKIDNRVNTPFPSVLRENISISDIVKSGNQDNTSATSIVNAVSLKIIETPTPSSSHEVTELYSTTPETFHTKPSMDSMKIFIQSSSNIQKEADIYRVPTTDYQIETNTSFLIDISHPTNIENVKDAATVPQQEQEQERLNQKNILTTTTTTLAIVTTAGYVHDTKNTGLNISSQNYSVNMENRIAKEHSNINKTETLNPINDKNSVNATTLASTGKKNTEDIIKIVSLLDTINFSVNAKTIEISQPTSTNPSLSNDYSYIKTSESQASSVYATATDNVPDYNTVHIVQSVQKNPDVIVTFTETKLMNSSAPNTHTFSVTEQSTELEQYISSEAPILRTVDIQATITTAADYVTEKTNYYFATEAMLSQLNKLPNGQAETSAGLVKSITSGTAVTPNDFKTVPVYAEIKTIKDNAFIISSTQMPPKIVPDINIKMSTEPPRLTSKVMEPQTVKYNTESSLPILELPVAPTTTEPTHIFFDNTNQNTQPGVETTDFPQYVTSTVRNNIPKPLPSLPKVEDTTAQITTGPTHTTEFAQATILHDKTNQNVQNVPKTTDFPQYVTSTIYNNIPQSVPLLPIMELTAAERTIETTQTTVQTNYVQTMSLTATGTRNQKVQPVLKTSDLPENVTSKVNSNIPQSMPSLSTVAATMTTERTHNTILAQTTLLTPTGKPNQNVQTVIKTTDLPQYVISNVNNNDCQPMPSLPIKGPTASQMITELTDTTNAITTPLAGKTDQDIVPGIKTRTLPQFVTVSYRNPQSIGGITTETITDTTVTDSMVENIKVIGDKVSGTHLSESILSDVMSNTPTVNNYSDMSVKNIIDHESIVVGPTSKNYEQNKSIAFARSVDINKAEIVNHTGSIYWMPSDVNIDSVKIKESAIQEEDLNFFVLKSGTDVPNKTLNSGSVTISKIHPKDGKSDDKIEYRLTTVLTDYKQDKTPNNVMQSKTIITSEKKIAAIDSSVNATIGIIGVKIYQVQVDSKNISDSYGINNTKAIITTSLHDLSLQNGTINDEEEQHLILSANHTITTEVQSHLNENDKQCNKTSKEPAINGTRVNNPYLTRTKNASCKDTSAITVPASIFNCSNHTRGKYSDMKDCRKFYTCVGNLQPIIGTCPNNTVFSEINKQCTRNLSHCVRNNQFRCLLEGRFTDFFKDNIYYICVKNRNNHFIRYKLQCQDDYHLNKDSIKCEKNEEISPQSGDSVSETINDESKPNSKSGKLVSLDDFECEKEGKFPNANDFSKYYICVKNRYNQFIRYKLQCQSGYLLNKDSVKCEKNEEISTQSGPLVSETINHESKSKPKSEKIIMSDFECEKEGKFPYAKDCSKYYECTKVKDVYRRKITKCASDDVFDKKKKQCVVSDSEEC